MTDSWNAIAAFASAISATAAFSALCFSANQNGQTSAALSFTAAQKFSDECRQRWIDYEAARTAADCSKAIYEILGSFELFSVAVNDGALTPRVRSYIVETLCDYINGMHEAGCSTMVKEITVGNHVCKELKLLIVQHHELVKNRKGVADMLNIPTSSLS